ncbi:hypothetical protein HUW46_09186 [Amycolatopsis sp. CA-230715]|nr:hypothetical protein HUW46_09186 [Amycolatopsis sp. CA-230715]
MASASRWTVSGRVSDDDTEAKVPIDVRHLLAGCTTACRHDGKLRGAFALNDTCLMDLAELTVALPHARNHAFYLQTQTDGLVVIDIEPTCPPDIAADLLRLPDILYSELSMSARGYHLIAPVPANLHDFPTAAGKRVLREEHGWYEILFDHWVTFTRTPIPERIIGRAAAATAAAPRFASVNELYRDLAEHARVNPSMPSTAVGTGRSMPEIPHAAEVVEHTLLNARGRLRGPSDFDDDLSRWEFSVLGTLYHEMQVPLRTYSALGVHYSTSDRTWLLYRAALEVIPARAKHHQSRNGRAFLLDRAAALVADREAAALRAPHEGVSPAR